MKHMAVSLHMPSLEGLTVARILSRLPDATSRGAVMAAVVVAVLVSARDSGGVNRVPDSYSVLGVGCRVPAVAAPSVSLSRPQALGDIAAPLGQPRRAGRSLGRTGSPPRTVRAAGACCS